MPAISHFSVVRYVADPVRNEPRNIGVVVLGARGKFARARFWLGGAEELRHDPGRYRLLCSVLSGCGFELPASPSDEFEVQGSGSSTLDRLKTLHEESTNLVQFTVPLPAPGDPGRLLEETYQERVAPRYAMASRAGR